MTDEQLRTLIKTIVSEVLAGSSTPAPRSALVLFTGALLGFEESLGALGRLNGELQLDWIQTPSAERILDQDAIARVGMTKASASLTGSHDLLIIPTLTTNMTAKVSHGISDCLASNVFAEFIMSNKPVVASFTAACPDSREKRSWFPDMPSGYQEMLRENLARLRSFGVHLSSAAQLDEAVRRAIGTGGQVTCQERVITADVVKSMPSGSVIQISRTALVTDLARETAAEAGITMERV